MTHDQPATPQHRLAAISSAAASLATARLDGSELEIEAALQGLRSVVLDASDADVGWSAIGKVLGLTRGNAYQRFRRRPLK